VPIGDKEDSPRIGRIAQIRMVNAKAAEARLTFVRPIGAIRGQVSTHNPVTLNERPKIDSLAHNIAE
jgi:hypothetical protein